MTLKQLEEKKKELSKQLEKVEKEIRAKTLIGYRAILYGDEYSYGTYSEYLFKEFARREAKAAAENLVRHAKNGGHVENVYKGQER